MGGGARRIGRQAGRQAGRQVAAHALPIEGGRERGLRAGEHTYLSERGVVAS